jgi:hypothetical protein
MIKEKGGVNADVFIEFMSPLLLRRTSSRHHEVAIARGKPAGGWAKIIH